MHQETASERRVREAKETYAATQKIVQRAAAEYPMQLMAALERACALGWEIKVCDNQFLVHDRNDTSNVYLVPITHQQGDLRLTQLEYSVGKEEARLWRDQ